MPRSPDVNARYQSYLFCNPRYNPEKTGLQAITTQASQ
jgi:hypothetical protein